MRLIALTLALLAFPAAAAAKRAHAATDTLIMSGLAGKNSNWSNGRPGLGTEVLIPAGKEAIVKTPQEWGSTTVEGRVAGPSSLKVQGSLHVTHEATGAEWDLDGPLAMTGYGTVAMGGEPVYYFAPEGYERLTEPLQAASIFTGSHAILATEGQPVTVEGEFYQTIGSDLLFGSSTVTAGFWDSYGNYGVLEASEATVVVDGLIGGSFADTLECESSDVYGAVSIGGIAPVSRGSCKVLGALTFASSVVQIEGGNTIEAGSIATTGPTRVEAVGNRAGEPRGEATIVCGCAVPANVELVGVKVE